MEIEIPIYDRLKWTLESMGFKERKIHDEDKETIFFMGKRTAFFDANVFVEKSSPTRAILAIDVEGSMVLYENSRHETLHVQGRIELVQMMHMCDYFAMSPKNAISREFQSMWKSVSDCIFTSIITNEDVKAK